MVVPWVLDEMKTADLKDRCLSNRLKEVLSQLGGHPTASIPAACGGHAVVVVTHDTSEIDVTRPEHKVVGAGPMDGGARWGAFLHPLHAFTPDGTPLGTLHAQTWVGMRGPPKCASLSRGRAALSTGRLKRTTLV